MARLVRLRQAVPVGIAQVREFFCIELHRCNYDLTQLRRTSAFPASVMYISQEN